MVRAKHMRRCFWWVFSTALFTNANHSHLHSSTPQAKRSSPYPHLLTHYFTDMSSANPRRWVTITLKLTCRCIDLHLNSSLVLSLSNQSERYFLHLTAFSIWFVGNSFQISHLLDLFSKCRDLFASLFLFSFIFFFFGVWFFVSSSWGRWEVLEGAWLCRCVNGLVIILQMGLQQSDPISGHDGSSNGSSWASVFIKTEYENTGTVWVWLCERWVLLFL